MSVTSEFLSTGALRPESIALLRETPVSRLIAESIEALVVQGEIAPGARLNEVELARKFGVSRGPLREAIRLLEVGGLTRQEHNRGTYVRKIPLAEAAALYEVRAGLDALAGRLLCERLTPAQLAQLQALTDAMQQVGPDEIDRFHALNLEFHDALIDMTGNPALQQHYRKVSRQLALFRRRNLIAPSAIQNFAAEHAQIVALLAQRDASAVADALFAHAQGGKARMLKDGELAGVSDDQ